MADLSRRVLLGGTLAATLSVPGYLRGQVRPKVVVIGGGAGGATASRYLSIYGKGGLDITLVEDSEVFVSCFFSNHVIAGLRDIASITQTYDRLVSHYGVRKITARAVTIDHGGKTVRLADGSALPYDRLVLSPGVDMIYDSLPGYSAGDAEPGNGLAPHGWQGAPLPLKERLDALEDGQSVVIVAPPNPYRCPPGPYERASVIAHVLKAKGFSRSKIFILDAKDKFSKQALFEEGWAKHYPGVIQWLPSQIIGAIRQVDAQGGKVVTDFDTFEGALLNIIPAQRAGAIAAGLADATGYCPIDAISLRSSRDAAVHIVGDAAIAGEMPKSAFSANSQAKVVAAAIVRDLVDKVVEPPGLKNTCWSMLEEGDSVKIGGDYAPVSGKLTATDSFISKTGEDTVLRRSTYDQSVRWYDQAVRDMFG